MRKDDAYLEDILEATKAVQRLRRKGDRDRPGRTSRRPRRLNGTIVKETERLKNSG